MTKLSEHFTLEEMIASRTADEKGIFNYPNTQQINNLKLLCVNCLEYVRHLFNKPIIVTSGYRSEALNRALKGSTTSHHCKGMACDFIIKGLTVKEVVEKIKKENNIKYTQLIEEHSETSSWIHIAYDVHSLKCETLLFKNGKYSKI